MTSIHSKAEAPEAQSQSTKTSHSGFIPTSSIEPKTVAPAGDKRQSAKTSHGGAASTSGIRKRRGAQPGNRQAFKTGLYTKKMMAIRKDFARAIRNCRALLYLAEPEVARREGRKPRKRIRIPMR